MSSSLAIRLATLALSGGAHAMVAFATFGHAPHDASIVVEPLVTVGVTIEEPPPPESSTPSISATTRRVASPSPTHPSPVPLDHDARPHDPSLVHAPLPAKDTAPNVDAPASSAIARFSMRVSTGDPTPNGHAVGGPPGNGPAADPDATPVSETGVSVPARLLGSASPTYPPGARSDEIEADVSLELVVARDGRVLEARVVRRAGYGFDEEALASVRGARFSPALRDGHPVAVRMRWTVSFRLR